MLGPQTGAYEYNGIAFKMTLLITRSFTGYRKGDKDAKEIKKERKEIKNEDVEECPPRLILAAPFALHPALLTTLL